MRVLPPMKSVVNAVTDILGGVRSNSRRHSDPAGVHAPEERVKATLSSLVAASETHATSAGLSPVDLLDTAARRQLRTSDGLCFFGMRRRPSRSCLHQRPLGWLRLVCALSRRCNLLSPINVTRMRHHRSGMSGSQRVTNRSRSRIQN